MMTFQNLKARSERRHRLAGLVMFCAWTLAVVYLAFAPPSEVPAVPPAPQSVAGVAP